MKKLFALLLSLSLMVCLCACGGGGNPSDQDLTPKNVRATVHNNQGKTEYLTAKQLHDLSNSNNIAFMQKYQAAKVTVTGTVTEIGGLSNINGTDYRWTLTIEGGEYDWFIGKTNYNKSSVTTDFLASLNIGDTVTISGEIVGAGIFDVDISNGTISVKKN